mmetsp:Transcript_29241/g.38449  ORF Transcript_29241/g.38449 Transcript_29241/m.38449 type:complete len:403 (-) Transcript_29241:790-1998(-)|eukprot:CAMPEP_0117751978 /NCGR_PEP_ID=MMETSP0947-20121206/11318_1 /TAXON_ID=44440 /ORGANISM="Chattonella subsalsa, Strain CCMP2191" /LENGTH=402 /DNA_ID=CAMNT_0005570505 /DNA_START=163 /DNA_END=1371 /DNA_ORIENTATION=+
MRQIVKSHILGVGMTTLGRTSKTTIELMKTAVNIATERAGVQTTQIEGILAVPSLDYQFMLAHSIGTHMGILPSHKTVIASTIDSGGASPVSALLIADSMIKNEGCDLVAIVAADKPLSMGSQSFLSKADQACEDPENELKSPKIPHGYDLVAQLAIRAGTLTREQLAMVAVLMSRQAIRHPYAMTKRPLTLTDVLTSTKIAPVTNIFECARRSDGGAAILVCSSKFLETSGYDPFHYPVILGGGRAAGPLYPPKEISEACYLSCHQAVQTAYITANVGPKDIDFFGLYDCFPITFIRAVEATGLSEKGKGGEWVEKMYLASEASGAGALPTSLFPVNTHGGLLGLGAPWEVPAMYSIIEAFEQLTGNAGDRQIPNARRALVYGNGGIFSASSVAILANMLM